MKKITLDKVIKEHQTKDIAFADYYQKELFINAISKKIVKQIATSYEQSNL